MRTFECILRNYDRKKNTQKALEDEILIKKRKFVDITPSTETEVKTLKKKEKENYFTSGPQQAQGHTGFLTFAIKQ